MDDAPACGHSRFERAVLPHLDGAFTLARYLTRDQSDAEDAVQEGVLRALRYIDTLRDDADARAWLFAIVRRECHDVRAGKRRSEVVSYEETAPSELADARESQESVVNRQLVNSRVQQAIDALNDHLREALILREVQQCSYEAIAMITAVPIGTVMSRLSRARARVAESLRGLVDPGDLD